jgi:hypothetical protein
MNTRPLVTCAARCTATPTASGRGAAGSSVQSRWWMGPLRQIAFAALRLHEYRYLRTRLFHQALARDDRDCGVATEPAQTTKRH